ncbi:hypothetical protein Tco_0727304 [Tanacetum coccineum]|uniref:Retrovirus-related Pol polyprotein from transposon TNT 1-94 n=1 Tax=Tanacetum coccineum TaxID=301880 RepID=A0ABQ4YK86_9ASTR
MVPPNNLGPDLVGKPINETSYRGMIGSLMYLTLTKLNIQFSTVLCARYQSNPKESHLTVVKRILKYSKDSDYAGCDMDKKSTSVPAKYLVKNWFVGVLRNSSQWLCPQLRPNIAIAISNNPVIHSRTKHIDIRYHFIRDHILKGDIELHFIPTEYQLTDIFTKPLDEPTFTRLKTELGMLNID